MAPLPKRKYPKPRQHARRSHHRVLMGKVVECTHCHSPRLAHHVCKTCGWYRGREAIIVKLPELQS